MARDGPKRASLVQAGVRIHGWAQAERRGGAGPWLALTLEAGQGSGLLLLLQLQESSLQDVSSRSSQHSSSRLEATLML